MSCGFTSSQDLIELGQGLVRSLALAISRKVRPNIELDDLIAYGQLGLVEAARDFDPTRGNQFSTYAYYRIRGAIYDGLSKMNCGGRTHRNILCYERMANETLCASAEESNAADGGGGEDQLRWFRDLDWSLLVVYLAAHGRHSADKDDIGAEREIVDTSTRSPPALAISREIEQKLLSLIDALPVVEANLIRMVYFDDLSLEQAGKRLGISKSWASRLHARTLHQLGRSLRLCGVVS
jgi:RNA polymerase sigma factor FliA